MRWRWRWKGNDGKWKWDDDENEITNYLPGTWDRGTQKRQGKKENTNTPGPERANPERAREEKKRTDDRPNAKPTSAREGPQTWPRDGARMRKGTNGELVDENDASTCACKSRDKAQGPRHSFQPHGRLSVVSNWIKCTVEPYQRP